jgi:hypothetical protein
MTVLSMQNYYALEVIVNLFGEMSSVRITLKELVQGPIPYSWRLSVGLIVSHTNSLTNGRLKSSVVVIRLTFRKLVIDF